jgi:hypothetical protein
MSGSAACRGAPSLSPARTIAPCGQLHRPLTERRKQLPVLARAAPGVRVADLDPVVFADGGVLSGCRSPQRGHLGIRYPSSQRQVVEVPFSCALDKGGDLRLSADQHRAGGVPRVADCDHRFWQAGKLNTVSLRVAEGALPPCGTRQVAGRHAVAPVIRHDSSFPRTAPLGRVARRCVPRVTGVRARRGGRVFCVVRLPDRILGRCTCMSTRICQSFSTPLCMCVTIGGPHHGRD